MANPKSEQGFSLIAILAVMTIFAIALLAVAPTVQIEVQREKELEAIRRGEEVAEAVRQFIIVNNRFPDSMDELLEGLPDGTKKRMILRPSAAIDPLSEDGKWSLVPINKMAVFTRRVQNYNNGILPSSDNVPRNVLDQLGQIVTSIELGTEDDIEAPASQTDQDTFTTENTPFIGVASQSESKSVIRYYGIGNHSKWVFTPLFRGSGASNFSGGSITPQPQPTVR
ncbi:MAG: type II secretion system protein [Pyrinomonadaceae bacterium]